MNPLNADQREQQLTRLLEAVSKERDAALAQLELERREKGELVESIKEGCRRMHMSGVWDFRMSEAMEVFKAALTPQEAPDGR
jgi:hypothetical protein